MGQELYQILNFDFSKISIRKLFAKTKISHPPPKPWFRLRILDLGYWNPFSKTQNRFLQFFSNLVSRPKNLKSAMSKPLNLHFRIKIKKNLHPKSWFCIRLLPGHWAAAHGSLPIGQVVARPPVRFGNSTSLNIFR